MVRVARLAGWTYEEMRSQPLSYVYELAADAQLESESIRQESNVPASSSTSAPGGGRQRIIRYTMKG
ncbi:hypothetical protein D187_008738 [Cystobacter fuscus DSM 2262]|uniref:Uncharacterized protein n=1 Tax=Cystobacter fuscus (strain ATCC 25194 / DSM 2262 / NBRC 100088 / M29) TaxID=1242864 RepID=S9PDV9_CYSF2|nr:hypothetical protein D187_008738 [Cystobacter fuscus DSM 2262]